MTAQPEKTIRNTKRSVLGVLSLCAIAGLTLWGCADVNTPGARNANIPSPAMADPRPEAINEQPDSVLYLPLGSDVLVPEAIKGDRLPDEIVGPFELRSETLAGALQLILADYQIPLAFETNEGLTRTITVANLRGPLSNVVDKVCGLADLYCSFEDGLLVIKDLQTFTVTIPPVGEDDDILSSLATGVEAITGQTPITENATRTIIYEATSRTARLAERYFQRVRANTALVVFEVYIWEVSLNSDNATGIDWQNIDVLGKYTTGINIPGGVGAGFTPISIGLPTITGTPSFDGNDVLEFISNYGSVKTISQPQITVLSGSEATLRAADTINYVSSLSRSVDNGEVTTSTETDSVDTGFTLTISSVWDKATIYGDIEIELQEFRRFQNFDADGTTLQLPETTERELQTQIRIRPGDSLLIAGLVRENDQFDKSGPGFNQPIFPTSRSATVSNTELVFLLKPRVIVYTAEGDQRQAASFGGSAVPSSSGPVLFPTTTVPLDMLNPAGN
ncbi:MAG: type II and III secretion system family protein [Pseudomonadota bacterium]